MLRPQREVARAADHAAVLAAHRHERQLGPGGGVRERRVEVAAQLLARLRLRDAQPLPRARVARCLPEAVLVRGRHRLEPDELAFQHRCRPVALIRLSSMPIYEYACMECESHFEELVRNAEQAVACPDCGAGNVLKQFSMFAVAGVSSQPKFGGGGGGGCCGGSCGCG